MEPQDSTTGAHGETALTTPDTHHGDEMLVMYAGFAIAIIVAGIFLIYIVLGEAQLLK